MGTAYYFASGSGDIIKAEGRPCYNGDDGFVNPFPSDKMVFQPSGSKDKNGKTTYVNQLGGTYGPVRTRKDGSIKWHRGWDIAAAVGTPIFAACDGIIVGGRRYYCSEQPNRIKVGKGDYNYPDGYTGDDSSLGDRIFIISASEPSVMVGYNHLQAGNPIAKNPRTGEPYKPGDSIMKGDIIGYVGQTGNAVEAIGTHLHLEIRVKGRFADPANYVNGAINWKDKSKKDKLIDYKIIDISCEEYINNND